GLCVVDATNPANPVVGGQVSLVHGSHTDTPVGDTGYVYIGAYNLFNPTEYHRLEIVDVRDFRNPHVARTWTWDDTIVSGGCHDTTIDLEHHRAICAGIQETMLWDITDPLQPVVLAHIVNPLISIHHSSAFAKGGSMAILGDEFLGALVGGGCGIGQGKLPVGAMWFYDISIPQAPLLVGYVAPPPATSAAALCTVHNFNVMPGTDIAVSAAYETGSFMVDFSNPTLPQVLDHEQLPGADTWATYAYGGPYAFTGDLGRGFDVFRLDP
ncbi:MAG: hypothetical protein LC624_02940, partial [Halobacteriales archaeon]|nr:hypothetical protein [Halobacteriales archaeon]